MSSGSSGSAVHPSPGPAAGRRRATLRARNTLRSQGIRQPVGVNKRIPLKVSRLSAHTRRFRLGELRDWGKQAYKFIEKMMLSMLSPH